MKKLFLLILASSMIFCSCKEILDMLPADSITQDEVQGLQKTKYKSEAEIIKDLDTVYVSLGEYIKYQNEIEKLYLVDQNFDVITPGNTLIEKAWTAAYDAIKKANYVIRSLETDFILDGQVYEKYYSSCYGLIGFIYKNLFEHWGNVPIIEPYFSETDMIPTASEDEVWNYSNKALGGNLYMLEGYDFSDSKRISFPAVLLALSELEGYRDFNRGYDFCRQFSDRYQADMESVFELETPEGNIIIYTPTHAYYYRCEYTYAMGNWDELGVRDFNTLLRRWNSSDYGYWLMLKRNKKLSEITGCPEHMNYFPVPQKAMNSNPNLLQNPGY